MKNFERFDHIQDVQLRVYNRVILMFNLMKDFGEEASRDYAGLFNDGERKQMFIMQQFIRERGIDEVKKTVTRNMEFDGYDASSE